MSDEEPNYKDSQKIVGQLYPILKSKNGKIIDGFHRQAVDPNWKTLVLPEIDTEEKLLIARAVSNWHRRQVPYEEKAEWINGLARIYKKQGLKISDGEGHKNEIIAKIVEVTGLDGSTVGGYLSSAFKQPLKDYLKEAQKPKISAIERAENVLGSEVVKRLRKEIKKEEKLSPHEKAKLTIERQHKREEREKKREEARLKREEQLRRKIEEETKQKLLKDKDFIEEAKSHMQEEVEEIEEPKTVEDTQNLEQFLTRYATALKTNPQPKIERDDVQIAIDFFKQLLNKNKVICPICGENHLQWRCGHEF